MARLHLTEFDPGEVEILQDTPALNDQTIYEAFILPNQNADNLTQCVIRKTVIDNSVVGTQTISTYFAINTTTDQFTFDKVWSNRAVLTYQRLHT